MKFKMLISYNWIKDFKRFFEKKKYIDNYSIYDISNILINQSLEVTNINNLKEKYRNIIIIEKEKHLNANELSLCKVFDGKELIK